MLLRTFKETTEKWFGGYDYSRINFMIYALGGFWSLNKAKIQHSRWKIRLYYLFNTYLSIIYLAIFSGMAYDFYLIGLDIEKLSYNLSSSIFFTGATIHLLLMSAKKIPFEDCLYALNCNFFLDSVGKSDKDGSIIQSGDAELRRVSIFFYILLIVGVLARIVCHLIPSEKMLVAPFPFFDPLETPYFEIIFAIQSVALLHFITVVVTLEMVIYGVFISLRKQLEIMEKNICEIGKMYRRGEACVQKEKTAMYNVEDFSINKKNYSDLIKCRLSLLKSHHLEYLKWRQEKTNRLMKSAIIHHQNIINMTRKMNALLQDNLLIQIFGGGVLLSMLCVDVMWKSQKLSVKTIAQTIYAGGFMVNSTFVCYYGSKFEAQFQKVANSLYSIPWDEMNTINRKTTALFLMALKANPTVRGRLFPINLRTYVKLIKFIYNTVAFMQNAAKRNK